MSCAPMASPSTPEKSEPIIMEYPVKLLNSYEKTLYLEHAFEQCSKILPFGSRIHDKNFGTIKLYILWLPNPKEESFENINNN